MDAQDSIHGAGGAMAHLRSAASLHPSASMPMMGGGPPQPLPQPRPGGIPSTKAGGLSSNRQQSPSPTGLESMDPNAAKKQASNMYQQSNAFDSFREDLVPGLRVRSSFYPSFDNDQYGDNNYHGVDMNNYIGQPSNNANQTQGNSQQQMLQMQQQQQQLQQQLFQHHYQQQQQMKSKMGLGKRMASGRISQVLIGLLLALSFFAMFSYSWIHSNFLGYLSPSFMRESDSGMYASVILACTNVSQKLPTVINTILEMEGLGEVIIVDNLEPRFATDAIKRIYANPKVRRIRIADGSEWSSIKALNMGASIATYENLMLSDCDVTVTHKFFLTHTKIVQDLISANQAEVSREKIKAKGSKDKDVPSFPSTKLVASGNVTLPSGILSNMNVERPSQLFFTGWWFYSSAVSKAEVSVITQVRRDIFEAVGGYDERITDRAEAQRDLELRLMGAKEFKPIYMMQISSNTAFRMGLDSEKPTNPDTVISIQRALDQRSKKRLADTIRPAWFEEYMGHVSYHLSRVNQRDYKAVAVRTKKKTTREDIIPKGDKDATAVSEAVAKEAEIGFSSLSTEEAKQWEKLHNVYEVPEILLSSMTDRQRKSLLRRLDLKSAAQPNKIPRLLVAHVMHGMGNRLRALGSCISFATKYERVLIILWPDDAHLRAKMEDLFDVNNIEANDFIAISAFPWSWSELKVEGVKRDKAWASFALFNYMDMEGEGAVKDQWIENDPSKSYYYKGAYVMNAPSTNWETDSRNIQKLEPIAEVGKSIDYVMNQVGSSLSNVVGVHVRNLPLTVDIQDVKKEKEYNKEAMETMDFWRAKANPRNFVTEMQKILREDPNTRFFVAADSESALQTLEAAFPPGYVIYIPKSRCDSREVACVRLALADVLCLAKTRLLLGSNWSSFTELAQRLGAKKSRLAGVDFGL